MALIQGSTYVTKPDWCSYLRFKTRLVFLGLQEGQPRSVLTLASLRLLKFIKKIGDKSIFFLTFDTIEAGVPCPTSPRILGKLRFSFWIARVKPFGDRRRRHSNSTYAKLLIVEKFHCTIPLLILHFQLSFQAIFPRSEETFRDPRGFNPHQLSDMYPPEWTPIPMRTYVFERPRYSLVVYMWEFCADPRR